MRVLYSHRNAYKPHISIIVIFSTNAKQITFLKSAHSWMLRSSSFFFYSSLFGFNIYIHILNITLMLLFNISTNIRAISHVRCETKANIRPNKYSYSLKMMKNCIICNTFHILMLRNTDFCVFIACSVFLIFH